MSYISKLPRKKIKKLLPMKITGHEKIISFLLINLFHRFGCSTCNRFTSNQFGL